MILKRCCVFFCEYIFIKPISFQSELPLIAACKEGHTDTVQLLIDNGADINKSNKVSCVIFVLYDIPFSDYLHYKSGDSPLLAACEADNIDIVQKLIDIGADINKSNEVLHI